MKSLSSTIIRYGWVLILSQMFAVATVNAADLVNVSLDFSSAQYKAHIPYIECVFAEMDQPYKIHSVPWGRAQRGTEHGVYDGFFFGPQNAQGDHYAVFSTPIYNFEWLYVVRKDSGISPDDPDFADRIFAAKAGSARLSWLLGQLEINKINQGVVAATDSRRALNMLSKGHIDVYLANGLDLKLDFITLGLNAADFNTFVAKEKQMGAYFSKAFLQREPGFMNKFNAGVKACKWR